MFKVNYIQTPCKHCSYFVINICDVHTVEDVVFEIILQDSPKYVKRNVGSERTSTLHLNEIQRTNTSKPCMSLGWKVFICTFSLFAHVH